MSKRLSEIYAGLSQPARSILIKGFQLNHAVTDNVLLDMLEDLTEKYIDPVTENNRLRKERATLTISIAIQKGLLKESEKETYIKLATADLVTTMDIVERNATAKIEISELMKLSGKELYMAGKLERLKELSQYHFNIKYEQLLKG